MHTITHTLVLVCALVFQAPVEQPVDRAAIEERIDALQESVDIDPGIRERATSEYRDALLELTAALESDSRAAQLERDIGETNALVESIRSELAEPVTVLPADESSLSKLEQALGQTEADEKTARESTLRLEDEAKFRADRVPLIPAELAELQESLAEIESALRSPVEVDLDAEPARAHQVLLSARRDSLRAGIRKLETERAFYTAREEVLPLRIERWARRLNAAKRRANELRELVNAARQKDAVEAAVVASTRRKEIAERQPQLVDLAHENEALTALRAGAEGLPSTLANAEVELAQSERMLDQLRSEFASTKRKVQVAGLSDRMGAVLRLQFAKLPLPSALRRDADAIRRKLGEAQFQLIGRQEERSGLRDLGPVLSDLMDHLEADSHVNQAAAHLSEEERAELRIVAEELLVSKRSNLDRLIEEYTDLSETTAAHVAVLESLASLCRDYRDYVKERILWVSSVPDSKLPAPDEIAESAKWLFDGAAWAEVWELSVAEGTRRGKTTLALLALPLVALFLRKRLARGSGETADRVRSFRTDAMGETLLELLRVVGFAAPLPLAFWFLAWALMAPPEQVDVGYAVGNGLNALLVPVTILSLVRASVRRRGLCEAHFRWPSASVDELRRGLRAFFVVFIPGLFVAYLFQPHPERTTPEISWSDSTGRLGLIVAMCAIVLLAWRLTRNSSAFVANLRDVSASSIRRRSRVLASTLAILVPASLALIALAGYYYTAVELGRRFGVTVVLILAVVLLHSLLLRWLFVARRRLAVEQARQRSLAREGAVEGAEESDLVSDDTLDIPVVDAQTRKLFQSAVAVILTFGIYLIWADQLPALRILERIQLWPEVTLVSAEESEAESERGYLATTEAVAEAKAQPVARPPVPITNASSEPLRDEAESPTRITLADVVLALLASLLTLVAARNIPGLLEIALLQRLTLDSGLRFAISTLFRYAILVIGVSAALGALGVGWAKVQWLAAAFTFGLAFGLQEIFANFVSGLIILIERPIRVGDIVTVNGVEGRVTQLKMRATTIIDWDRRELLVPNKEFITASLINWTLSDPVTRTIIRVGIAYGSDTALARKLLLKSAKRTEGVLDDPKPSAVFLSFGESSLDFELRVFLADRDQWAKITDRLHSDIDQLFREAGIEIAFPQRDLHVRSAEGLGAESPRGD